MIGPPAGGMRGNSVMHQRLHSPGENIVIGNGMMNIRWLAPCTGNNMPDIRWPTSRMYKMNRLVRIPYGKDSKSRTKRGLRLGERPKDIMTGPPAGRMRGNSVMTSRPGRSHNLKVKVTECQTLGGPLHTRTECIKPAI